ncbi:MAG: hypothetical protein IKM35_04270 [Bacteroidaceae bacterium]|nr:hypothetical protein [Bacteroidaceae bacterium]
MANAKFYQCPTCGNPHEASVYRCKECGALYCERCNPSSYCNRCQAYQAWEHIGYVER